MAKVLLSSPQIERSDDAWSYVRTLVGWLVSGEVSVHTGPGMGLLGARVQLASIQPPGTRRSKIAPKVQPGSRERERDANPRNPIGLAASPRFLEKVSN